MRRLLRLTKAAFRIFGRARASLLSAAISFYAIFSLAPIAVIAVAVAGLVLEDANLRDQIETYAARELGDGPARLLGEMMERAAGPGTGGLLASIIGVTVLLYASTRLFIQFQHALNQIWDHVPEPTGGIGRQVLWIAEKRLFSFALVILMGVLLLASVVASTAVSTAGAEIDRWIPLPSWTTRAMEIGAAGLLLAGVFTILFKFLPDVPVQWRPALVGGVVAAALFSVGRVALGIYFGRVAIESEYGAAGSLVVVILWIYYSAQVIFVGAAFTRAWTEDRREIEVGAPWRFWTPPAWRRDKSREAAPKEKSKERSLQRPE